MKNIVLLITTILLLSCELPKHEPQKPEVVVIEDCEYFVNRNTYGTVLTHKGNCKNPIHNQNKSK